MNAIRSVLKAFRNNAANNGLSIKTSLDDDVSSTIKSIEDKIDKISPCSVATTDLSSRVIVEISNKKEIPKKQNKNSKKHKSNTKKVNISFLSKPERDCFDNIMETYKIITDRFKSVDTVSDDMYDLCIKEIDICINLINAFINIIETYQDDRYNLIIDHVNIINDEIYEDKFGLQIRKKYLKVYNEFNNIINKILDLKHTHSNFEDYTYNVCKQCIPDFLPSPLKFKSNIKNINKVIDEINIIINNTVINGLRRSFIDGAFTYINRLEQIRNHYDFIYSKIVKMKRHITDTEMTIVIGVIDYIKENPFKEDIDKDVKKKLSKKASIKFKKLKTKYEITYAIKIQKMIRGWSIRYNWKEKERKEKERKEEERKEKERREEEHKNKERIKKEKEDTNKYLDNYKENFNNKKRFVTVHNSIKKEISLMANLYREKIFFDRQKFYYSTKTKQLHERKIF